MIHAYLQWWGSPYVWQRQWLHSPGELTAVAGGEEGAVGEGPSAMLASSSDCSASDSASDSASSDSASDSASSDSAALRRRGFLLLLTSLHKASGNLSHQQQTNVSQEDNQGVLASGGAQCALVAQQGLLQLLAWHDAMCWSLHSDANPH